MDELDIQQVKEKLLKRSEERLIKKTSFQIKKMNEQNARKQKIMAESADKIKNIIFDGVSKGLSYLQVIDEADSQKLENDLKENNYLEEEVINISKSIAPWIPYIGLTLAGISIGKYAYTRYVRHKQTKKYAQGTPEEEKNKQDGTDEVERGIKPDGTVPR